MSEKPAHGRDFRGRNGKGAACPREAEALLRRRQAVKGDAVSDWFVREILPLEASLMHYLRHNWRNANDYADFRQEIYTRVLQSARERIPDNAQAFLLTCARNFLVDLVRHSHVVPIDAVADLESLAVAFDSPAPDRSVIAREELRRLQAALDQLPPRAREAAKLAYVENLSGKEIAQRMGVTQSAASKHLANAIRLLTDILYGTPGERSEKP